MSVSGRKKNEWFSSQKKKEIEIWCHRARCGKGQSRDIFMFARRKNLSIYMWIRRNVDAISVYELYPNTDDTYKGPKIDFSYLMLRCGIKETFFPSDSRGARWRKRNILFFKLNLPMFHFDILLSELSVATWASTIAQWMTVSLCRSRHAVPYHPSWLHEEKYNYRNCTIYDSIFISYCLTQGKALSYALLISQDNLWA